MPATYLYPEHHTGLLSLRSVAQIGLRRPGREIIIPAALRHAATSPNLHNDVILPSVLT